MKNFITQKNGKENYQLNFQYEDILDYQSKVEYAQYFLAINDDLPHVTVFYGYFDAERLYKLLQEEYKNISKENSCLYQRYDKKEDKLKLSGFFVQLETDFLLYLDEDDGELKILHSDRIAQEQILAIISCIKKGIEEPKAESKIFLLYESQKTLCLKDFEVKKSHINIKENYNDDFADVHELIVKRLNTSDDKGLVLLYGNPGTGKTSYIRYLTSLINKRMIYIPPEYAYKIASPDFLPLLISNPNSVLIIEDAEEIVEAREAGRNISVSNLLNLSDGLLSDCLNIQIICTFNTHINNIDRALLRKGRLIATYEFKALATEKARTLSQQLGFQTLINEPMSLADIYNQTDTDFSDKNNVNGKIGFGR
ncbi:MAG: AAA family ATPase [Cytophagales bacterium]|nr:MAG: AAA family ATPase [Cytophagales bacterium]